MNVITKRKILFLAIYIEKEKFEKLFRTGKIEEKRPLGRQRQGYMDSTRRRVDQSWSGSEIIQQKGQRHLGSHDCQRRQTGHIDR